MKTKHTPGEWAAKESIVYSLENGQDVARCDIGGRDSTTEANARLIAAAPELLDALKDALTRVSEAIRNEDIPLDLIPDKVLTKWEKAITKATQP